MMPETTARSGSRHSDHGLEIAVFGRNVREAYLDVTPIPRELPASVFERAGRYVRRLKGQVVQQTIYGGQARREEFLDHTEREMGRICWPTTVLQGLADPDDAFFGIQILAVSGTPVDTLSIGDQPIGRVFSDGLARHCFLGDLGPSDPAADREIQTRQFLEALERGLSMANMDLSHVARTWLFLDNILGWYDAFNRVRTGFFRERKMREGFLPASTGVGAKNRHGAAVGAKAWATCSSTGMPVAREIASPLQCAAPQYGSSFSRAVEVEAPDFRRLMVSGTASIGPDGETQHIGDTKAQVDRTMNVVRGILDSRGLSFREITRAVSFFKRSADADLLERWCSANGVDPIPAVGVGTDICRDDLLFEIEVDAVD